MCECAGQWEKVKAKFTSFEAPMRLGGGLSDAEEECAGVTSRRGIQIGLCALCRMLLAEQDGRD